MAAATQDTAGKAEELERLAGLRERGVLSDDEFSTEKRLLLGHSGRVFSGAWTPISLGIAGLVVLVLIMLITTFASSASSPRLNVVPASLATGQYPGAAASPFVLSQRGFYYRSCTDYVAWREETSWGAFKFPRGLGNAIDWKAYAHNAGFVVTSSPQVNDIAWFPQNSRWGISSFGHVAVVVAVNNGTVTVDDYNWKQYAFDQHAVPDDIIGAYLHRPTPVPSQPAAPQPQPVNTPPTSPNGSQTGSTPAGSANSGVAHPTSGSSSPGGPSSTAGIGGGSTSSGASSTSSSGTPSPTRSPTPAPPPATPSPAPTSSPHPVPAPSPPPTSGTYAETVGLGATHTWTNYTNAGGYEGATIPNGTTIQVTCRIQGFRVADGDTWWYQIASAPWNDAYYASADPFFNNGQSTGNPDNGILVDATVPIC